MGRLTASPALRSDSCTTGDVANAAGAERCNSAGVDLLERPARGEACAATGIASRTSATA
jgi:hypothetical protein